MKVVRYLQTIATVWCCDACYDVNDHVVFVKSWNNTQEMCEIWCSLYS